MGWEFVVYKDAGGKWRWTLFAANAEKVATSGESFYSKQNAVEAAERIQKNAQYAKITVRT